jgi:hypothetical protein
MAIISIIMLSLDLYEHQAYQVTLGIIYNISYTWALYVLALFYIGTRTLLVGHSPVFKFMAVKLIVFFTFWQFIIISYSPSSIPSHAQAMILNDFILVLEMTIFAILHRYAFSYKEFVTPVQHVSVSILENTLSVLSVRDVVADVSHNFKGSYREYQLYNANGNMSAVTPVHIQGNGTPKYKTSTNGGEALLEDGERIQADGDVELESMQMHAHSRNGSGSVPRVSPLRPHVDVHIHSTSRPASVSPSHAELSTVALDDEIDIHERINGAPDSMDDDGI